MLTIQGAEQALERLSGESDRMADALVAMDSHAGHQLLRNASLTGLTKQRWDETRMAMTVLWEQFNLHRALLERARSVLDQRSKTTLGELTGLLTGPVVELNEQQIPIERRSLTGPAVVSERISLTELVDRMKVTYAEVTEVLAAADTAWSATVDRLDPLDTELRSVGKLAESLGVQDPALKRIRDEIAEIRRVALSDPLATIPPDKLASELAALRSHLDDLAAARDSFTERVTGIERLLTEIQSAQTQAHQASETVLAKIANPGLPAIPDHLPVLRAKLDGVHGTWRSGRWRLLAPALTDLEAGARGALSDATALLRTITGLLDRRAELRGRLDGFRAKANRLGHAEDLELGRLHREAHDLLYTIPCDLPAATRAVNRYQQALQDRRGPR